MGKLDAVDAQPNGGIMENIRSEVLHTAIELCNGQREEDYGSPAESMGVVAHMWSAYVGYEITARDVCNMMALLKIARLRNGTHEDSAADAAAYVAMGEEVGYA